MPLNNSALRIAPDIAASLARGGAVVALESSVLAQGLPIPANRQAAERMVAGVRSAGAVPAITAVVAGQPALGLTDAELERFLRRDGVRKVSARDLPSAMTAREDGATTVAATLALSRLAGVTVFATGGIGGVHRATPIDESADLVEMARTPMIVVCAGAKSVLDLASTMERLETLGVAVVGFRTDRLPGFFFAQTDLPVSATADSAAEIAKMWNAHRSLHLSGALLVVQPPPAEFALDRDEVEQAVVAATREAAEARISGPAVTPFLLGSIERATAGRSLTTNLALLESNARLAAEIAVELCGPANI